MSIDRGHWTRRLAAPALALLGPAILTAVLAAADLGNTRDYVFLYLAIVAVLGLASGLRDALVAATASFLLVDFFYVRPVHSLDFADATDLVNLCVFFGAAGVVGTLGSRRRAAQLRAESLAAELQQANIELARLDETERQVRALRETDRMRREVLANVSHELRTPLGSILTRITTLESRDGLPAALRDDVTSIATEARRLNRLVSELIDMTRIEGGIVEIQATEIDLGEALDAAESRLRAESERRAVETTIAPGTPEVLADWSRLGQVLDNLLENADHAAPAGTPIRIDARPGRAGEVVVRVIDAGPGVPEAMRARVFERFVRGDSDGRPSPGLGLGLPIVRGLVEAQGGRVWIEDSEAGEGARFAFSLPTAETRPATP